MQNIFEDLEKFIGWIIKLEKKMLFGVKKCITSIMVEMDITKGLPVEVEILWDERVIKQRLDYLHIPF